MRSGLKKWTNILSTCQTLSPREAFPNYHICPRSREGTARAGTAVLEFLNSQLFADQHIWEKLNTSVSRQTQSSCWISQIGHCSFNYKPENKVNSSMIPKSNSTTYCNTDTIILLSLCSVHLEHIVQWEPWCRPGLSWNGQVASTPFPFFLFGNYWYARSIFHKPQHIFFGDNNRYLTARCYLTPKALLPSKEFTATPSKQEITWRGRDGRSEYLNLQEK